MLPMASQTAGSIKTKLGIGTHVDPGSVLVKVKVKVDCDRGPQGRDNIRLVLLWDGYLQQHQANMCVVSAVVAVAPPGEC